MTQSFKEGSLYRVFGIVAIAKNSLGDTKDGIPVRHYKILKCRRIASPSARQQARFFLGDESRSFGCLAGFCINLKIVVVAH